MNAGPVYIFQGNFHNRLYAFIIIQRKFNIVFGCL